MIATVNHCQNGNHQQLQPPQPQLDSDVETQHPASDTDQNISGSDRSQDQPHQLSIAPEIRSILQRMEAVNRANEQDSRSVSGTGSRRSNDSSDTQSGVDGNFQSPLNIVEQDAGEDLWTVWGNLVKNWDVEAKKRPQYIKELVRQGIPCHFRTIAWQLLTNAGNVESIHEVYAEYMRSNSPHEKVIRRDISRTYPEHEFFRENHGRGQTSLFNVMKAYSLHDREVGYCQGSAFIAGLLLLQMPEEEAFAVLLRLMDDYRLRELYKPAMTELGLCMFQLECLVQELMPDLHMHFRNMGFDTSMYASSWFLTLFATQLPLELANRIMDVFMSEGMEMVFRVALAILQLCRFELLQLDMEGMLRCFQRDVSPKFEQDHDLLMTTAYNIKYNHKKLKRLEKDYLTKRNKEQEEAVELRRLRTENRLLRQRVEYLEQESAALADRLIDRQVYLAQEAENSVNIKHDLITLRDLNAEAHRRLEQAYETIRDLTNTPREGVADVNIQVDDQSMIEHIHALQQELMELRTREADHESTIRDLKNRIHELETANKRLKETPPDHCVAGLQEELIAVKMREAEANLSLKEMRQKIADLQTHWEKYVAQTSLQMQQAAQTPSSAVQNAAQDRKSSPRGNPPAAGTPQSSGSAPSPSTLKELQDQLMGVRMREAETLAELKEMRQRVMELETQNHVCTNQIRRQDDEHKKLTSELEAATTKQSECQTQVAELQNKLLDSETQNKEQTMMAKLKETELLSLVGEFRNKIAELERKNAEKFAHEELNKTGSLSFRNFDDDMLIGTPTSLTTSLSLFNAETASICSEADFATYLSDMAVKIPQDALLLDNNNLLSINDEDQQKNQQRQQQQQFLNQLLLNSPPPPKRSPTSTSGVIGDPKIDELPAMSASSEKSPKS